MLEMKNKNVQTGKGQDLINGKKKLQQVVLYSSLNCTDI